MAFHARRELGAVAKETAKEDAQKAQCPEDLGSTSPEAKFKRELPLAPFPLTLVERISRRPGRGGVGRGFTAVCGSACRQRLHRPEAHQLRRRPRGGLLHIFVVGRCHR